MKDKKELELEDLEKVTGGLSITNCPNFVQALRKPYINQCENCFYYNKDVNNEFECTLPDVKVDKAI